MSLTFEQITNWVKSCNNDMQLLQLNATISTRFKELEKERKYKPTDVPL